MEREACVCDHGFERSDLCAEIIIIIIIYHVFSKTALYLLVVLCRCSKRNPAAARFQRQILHRIQHFFNI